MPLSGQITVPTAGTAVRGDSEPGSIFLFTPHPDNSGVYVWVGNAGNNLSSTSGYPLLANIPGALIHVNNLADLYFDVSANGDKICWLKVR